MGVHVAVFLSSAGYSCAADISWEQGFKVPNAQGTDWWLRAMGHSMDSSQTSPEVPFPDVGSGQVRITWLTNQSYPDPRVRGRSPSFLVPHNWRNIPGRDFLLMLFSFAVSVTNYACPYMTTRLPYSHSLKISAIQVVTSRIILGSFLSCQKSLCS